jgi:uncharacterized caspase-like protein
MFGLQPRQAGFFRCTGPAIVLLVALIWANPARAANPATLHYLAVGVSQNPGLPFTSQLRFAHKDAQDFARFWQSQAGTLYGKVGGVTLIDREATGSKIVAALNGLIAQVRAGDIVKVCLCGHGGFCGNRGEWCFLPYDYNETRGGGDAALSATALRSKLADLAGRGVTVELILDCCHAGAFGLQSCDFIVFAACLPGEASREHLDWDNGLFTKAYLEGVRGKADFNGDGTVTLAELDAYVSARVEQLLREHALRWSSKRESQSPSCGRPTSIPSSLPLARLINRGAGAAASRDRVGRFPPPWLKALNR